MPARDPFYDNRAAEIKANIVLAELDMFRGTVFSELTSFRNGDVLAITRSGNQLRLAWDVTHQCIQTVGMVQAEDQQVLLCA